MTVVPPNMQRLVNALVRRDWGHPKILAMLSLYPRDVVYMAIMRAEVDYLVELGRKLID